MLLLIRLFVLTFKKKFTRYKYYGFCHIVEHLHFRVLLLSVAIF